MGYAHCRRPLLEQAFCDLVYTWIRISWFCLLNGPEQRELEDSLEREIKDGVGRENKDGVEREIEDGLEQEIEDGLEWEIEAVKIVPNRLCFSLDKF